eukprot:6182232-Alexandrium_andersonii.AAC.1
MNSKRSKQAAKFLSGRDCLETLLLSVVATQPVDRVGRVLQTDAGASGPRRAVRPVITQRRATGAR